MLELEIPVNREDLGFIAYLLNTYKKKLFSDNNMPVGSDAILSMVSEMCLDNKARIFKVDGKPIAFIFLYDMKHDLDANFYLLFDSSMNGKSYRKLLKNNYLDDIIKMLFNTYKVRSFTIEIPEWLYHKETSEGKKKRASIRLFDNTGFKLAGIRRNYFKKDSIPQSIFIMQICRNFFFKWQDIARLYKRGFKVSEISRQYKVDERIIKEVASKKRWSN